MQATASIYLGLQLLLPGETAPAHRHTPSAARLVVEGRGGYAVVDGERLPMEVGDLVLTPGGEWHDHGHDGTDPVIRPDALDLPLFVALEDSYAIEGALRAQRNRPDASAVEYRAAGLAPSRSRHGPPRRYPMRRFPWARTEAALRAIAAHGDAGVAEVDCVNPETGGDVLPALGFPAMLLQPGRAEAPPLRSDSCAFHVILGSGRTRVDGQAVDWQPGDTFTAPVFAAIDHRAETEAFLLRIHDRPLQEKLGYYEERPR